MTRIRLSLALMLITALLVLMVGVGLSRKSEINRTSVNRDLMSEFLTQLGMESKKLDLEVEASFRRLAEDLSQASDLDGRELLDKIPGVRSGYHFKAGRERASWSKLVGPSEEAMPEIDLGQGRDPLVPERALVVPPDFFDAKEFDTKGFFVSPDQKHELRWFRLVQGEVVFLVVNVATLEGQLAKLLVERTQEYYSVLAETGEVLKVGGDLEDLNFEGANVPPDRGPSYVTSFQTLLGKTWLQAWDRVEIEKDFHWPTTFTAGGLALALVLAGGFLYTAQVRTFREAEARVSFVNRVTHELGTPLTNMSLNLELAARSLRSRPEAAGKRLEKVREETSRLNRLVTNVLTHSQREKNVSGKLADCDPAKVVDDVISQFRPALERRDFEIDWTFKEQPLAAINADAVSQIVWNLISNVEKYAQDGGWMGVEVATSDSDVVIEVSDRGPGIEKRKAKQIFKAFERVHDKTNEGVSGTGLGLSISRELARSLGGDLTMSGTEKGSTFRLIIPTKLSVTI